jgi:hypothetical protein
MNGKKGGILMGYPREFPDLRFSADYTGVTGKGDLTGLLPEYWTEKFIAALYDLSIFIRVAEDISGEIRVPMDKLYAYVETKLSGAGVTSDSSSLEGSEEKVGYTAKTFDVTMLDHAVAFTKEALLKTPGQLRERGKNLLANWFKTKMEAQLALAAELAPPVKIFCGSGKETVYEITANDILTLAEIDKAVMAMIARGVPGFSLGEISEWFGIKPEELGKAANPVARQNGGVEDGPWYIAPIHPGQLYDIIASDAWKSAANAAATATVTAALGARFQGRIYAYMGCLLLPTNQVRYQAIGDDYTVKFARSFVLGRSALAFGYAKMKGSQGVEWKEARLDYERINGIAIETLTAKGALDPSRMMGLYSALSAAAQSIIP